MKLRRQGAGARIGTLSIVLAIVSAIVACRKPVATVSDAGLPATVVAPDELAPGELPEGVDHAFGLPLPRGARIEQSFADAVYARASSSSDAVANYVRARVRDGTVTAGAVGTVFDGVRVPADPARVLHIRVIRYPTLPGCRLEVRDVTPAPAPNLPDEPSRWKAVGLTPDGKLADPKHLQ